MRDHVTGNPNASVVLVEYADFECPYCAMAEPYVKRVIERFHDDAAIVFRPFPLVEIHPHALHAAQAAEAAGLQDKFWQVHDILFEHQQRLDDASLLHYATTAGLDADRFQEDFGSDAVMEAIKRSMNLGREQGVEGTPTFILNDRTLQIDEYDELERAVTEAVTSATAKR